MTTSAKAGISETRGRPRGRANAGTFRASKEARDLLQRYGTKPLAMALAKGDIRVAIALMQIAARTEGTLLPESVLRLSGLTPAQQVAEVASAVAEGLISTESGASLTQMIAAGVKVAEITEIAERLARLEERLSAMSKPS